MSKIALIADDNATMRKLIKFYLKEFSMFEIIEANDGVQALAAIKKNDISLLFLDLSMPNIDGFNVANYLKDKENKPHIISVSASVDNETKLILKSLGVKYFLGKPLDASAFKFIVSRIVKTF